MARSSRVTGTSRFSSRSSKTCSTEILSDEASLLVFCVLSDLNRRCRRPPLATTSGLTTFFSGFTGSACRSSLISSFDSASMCPPNTAMSARSRIARRTFSSCTSSLSSRPSAASDRRETVFRNNSSDCRHERCLRSSSSSVSRYFCFQCAVSWEGLSVTSLMVQLTSVTCCGKITSIATGK